MRMYSSKDTIESVDAELARAIGLEQQRQEDHIELIASENYVSPRVMLAQGAGVPLAVVMIPARYANHCFPVVRPHL